MKKPVITTALVAVNVVVFLIMEMIGNTEDVTFITALHLYHHLYNNIYFRKNQ